MDINIRPRQPKPRLRPAYCPFTGAVLRWTVLGHRNGKLMLGFGPTPEVAFEQWRSCQ